MDDLSKKIYNDADYVNLKRFGFSLQRLLERYNEGVPNHIAANALMLTEEEYEETYLQIIEKLKFLLRV